ncbi:hypothetical protein CH263_22560 [Rhodococcus sp. 06-1059B-a]|nr:ferredoxin [Rhodococcus sp. 06-1059B-a]OZD59784.1 hypothetical protein CH263_22560 [Rhodococcus sp. 06-1059B-a]
MKVSVDFDRCQGHGRCYTLAPKIFEDDAAGYPVVKSAEITDSELNIDAERAAGACPEGAIHVLKGDAGKQSRDSAR